MLLEAECGEHYGYLYANGGKNEMETMSRTQTKHKKRKTTVQNEFETDKERTNDKK